MSDEIDYAAIADRLDKLREEPSPTQPTGEYISNEALRRLSLALRAVALSTQEQTVSVTVKGSTVSGAIARKAEVAHMLIPAGGMNVYVVPDDQPHWETSSSLMSVGTILDVLSHIDRDLQQATIFSNPYRGLPRAEKKHERGYRRGYRNGLAQAFTVFRSVAENRGHGWTPAHEVSDG